VLIIESLMNIPFYKPSIDQTELNAVSEILRSGWLTTGPRSAQFEVEFAAYIRQKHGVAMNSCTAALHLALEALGVRAGDSVLVPTLTFAATAEVVRYLGAKPVLVDCRSSDFNMDMEDAERQCQSAQRRGERVAAIMPVHYAGQIGDVEGVSALARRHDLKVIEDAAHCCPAFYRSGEGDAWKSVGTEADISCFSFYANKPITTGEGGMACTANWAAAERMRIMSLHGISRNAWKRFMPEGSWYYEIVDIGFKYNMTDIAAAIGLKQLAKADHMHRRREELASLYTQRLSDVSELRLPVVQPNRIHSWHLYVVRLRLDELGIGRNAIIEELKGRGIGTSVHYLPLHMHPYYREKFCHEPEDLPIAAGIYSEMISLPLYPGMSSEQVEYVCDSLKAIINSHLPAMESQSRYAQATVPVAS
jgi:dTDP-4-amino-4,6-dideoxygalactose transaminase